MRAWRNKSFPSTVPIPTLISMDGLTTPPPEIADIQFHPLSVNEWRVSDRRFPKESIDALLGFVAKKGDYFYATRMHHPLEATPLSSLDRVAAFFAMSAAQAKVHETA